MTGKHVLYRKTLEVHGQPRLARRPSEPKTTVLLKAGKVPEHAGDVFKRVFWKSEFLAGEAHSFWREVKKSEPAGLPIRTWKAWISKRGMSVGQFYNMIHGLTGAGMIKRRESKWHLSEGFQAELKAMLSIYKSEDGTETSRR